MVSPLSGILPKVAAAFASLPQPKPMRPRASATAIGRMSDPLLREFSMVVLLPVNAQTDANRAEMSQIRAW